ncbi:MAG: hypothetical protein M3082_06510 [Candidatus Dormibacteraeota bacterium]|nr:hypothetical protein [Candidatus Dormibacteraeota bacterium]
MATTAKGGEGVIQRFVVMKKGQRDLDGDVWDADWLVRGLRKQLGQTVNNNFDWASPAGKLTGIYEDALAVYADVELRDPNVLPAGFEGLSVEVGRRDIERGSLASGDVLSTSLVTHSVWPPSSSSSHER